MTVRPRLGVLRLALLGLVAAGATLAALGWSSPAAAFPVNCTPAPGVIRCVFAYTGRAQSWTVPAGITEATFDVFGAEGGSVLDFSVGGLGGEATATIPLTPGDTLRIMVGGQGQDVFSGGAAGGFNGGGNGGIGGFGTGGGGGGASDVRIGGTSLSARAIVAGGGGGAANQCGRGCSTGG